MPTTPFWAAPPQAGPLLPIGGGFSDALPGFAAAAVACATEPRVDVVVLPTAYSGSPQYITDAERRRNLADAHARRAQLAAACQAAAPAGVSCTVTIAPIFTRADACDPTKYAALVGRIAGIFILGGDQAVAMAALAGTPAEAAMAAAHAQGAVIGGTSAGSGMLSIEMLAGYRPSYAAGNSLDVGAADIWNTEGRRGLRFGVPAALLDQHFFQRGRLGRLLTAITTPGAPSLGIGIDAYTGARIQPARGGWTLGDLFGLYGVAVLDAGTYHAAESAQYTPLEDPARAPVLSLRNVLVHLLAAGAFSYDLTARRSSLAAPRPHIVRKFETLRLPAGAGPLILAGDLSEVAGNDPVLSRFRQLTGDALGRVLVYADGYASCDAARRAAERVAALLGVPAEVRTVDDWDVRGPEDMTAAALRAEDYAGVVLVGHDQSLVDVAALATWLPDLWAAGLPVLADNALGAVLGACYVAHGPTPRGGQAAEAVAQGSLRVGGATLRPGLALVAAVFEPQVLADNRWGRYFALAFAHPQWVAIGLNRGAALEIGRDAAWALGENVTFALDLRGAALAEGANHGFVIANGLLDVFAPGDVVRPDDASTQPATPPQTLIQHVSHGNRRWEVAAATP